MKASKRLVDLVLDDPDAGVGDAHLEVRAAVGPRGRRGPDEHLTGLGELHRVRAEVREHLREPGRVAAKDLGHVGVAGDDQLEALGPGCLAEHAGDLVEDRPHLEVEPLELQLAGLDLREVEDVVDDREQGAARHLHPGGEP